MKASKPHLLIVEDDEVIRSVYTQYLTEAGLSVTEASTGAEARGYLAADPHDLVILDLGLPNEDGLDLIREIRKRANTPIVIVSGRSDPIERVVGLEAGADDFHVKPFLNRELLARVRAVLRRRGWEQPAGGTANGVTASGVTTFQGWRLDLPARRLESPVGDTVHVTTAEFQVLAELARRMPEPVSRRDLLALVHQREWSPADRSIDIHISNLRRKIEVDPKVPRIIIGVRNVGYALAP